VCTSSFDSYPGVGISSPNEKKILDSERKSQKIQNLDPKDESEVWDLVFLPMRTLKGRIFLLKIL